MQNGYEQPERITVDTVIVLRKMEGTGGWTYAVVRQVHSSDA